MEIFCGNICLGKLIAAIKFTYKAVKAKIHIARRRSKKFELRKGMKQRDRGANLDTII